MSENLGRKTIAELEKLVNSPDQEDIEILPNGNVIRLTPEEVVKKNLRIAQETVDVLRSEAQELREGLKKVLADLDIALASHDQKVRREVIVDVLEILVNAICERPEGKSWLVGPGEVWRAIQALAEPAAEKEK